MSLSMSRPVVLLGAGKMGGAMLSGWLASGLSGDLVHVLDPMPSEALRTQLETHGGHQNTSVEVLAEINPAVVVLAVKPQMMGDILPRLAQLVGPETVFLSIAAGLSIAQLDGFLGGGACLVRTMPNTPASVGRGVTAMVANDRVSQEMSALCADLLAAIGEVVVLEDEVLIDAVTAVSGSGPAYVFHMVEAMAAAGVALGLPADLSMILARKTIEGSGEMMRQFDTPAGELRQNVTSPGGTTAAALEVLMGPHGLSELMNKALTAARDRSKELGA